MKKIKMVIWSLWILSSLVLAAYLGNELFLEKEKPNFLIGESTSGHYQIELACSTCHTEPFGGGEVIQQACLNCHADELADSLDSHPKKKFTDPRNADLIDVLDARYCATCHTEHDPAVAGEMGLTVPEDYCVQCHQDVGKERSTHEGMGFETCAQSGCHNYHDNRALYEDFLLKHGDGALLIPEKKKTTDSLLLADFLKAKGVTWQTDKEVMDANATVSVPHHPDINALFEQSAHARSSLGCLTCHADDKSLVKPGTENELSNSENKISEISGNFNEYPNGQQCEQCHQKEAEGFYQGKHGMRLSQGLSAMTPDLARQPMQQNAHKALTCMSCHDPHSVNRKEAAVDACLGCHADEHSQSFRESPHGLGWKENHGEGVSCATCHMPEMSETVDGKKLFYIEHNQNATLRPNEKMIRTACLQCHTLQFSLNALADEVLLRNNFKGQPGMHVESIDMAKERALK